ncbi:hypothetical protein BFJ63_vAg2642 [Fusarium oxysporum f. sp. narcissi]|uniref:Actin-like ATPase domain-containing protein n=2 Tax=Fusarium oxysporum TaxID=5507 RepID=A0A420Q7W7_FUSOX|nr:hypothetical protein BFJ68_g12657 [Fusarium oxysporum]RKL00834.1 hypothetical protein BFJ71_g5489 [Fusarium oxysporum]RYC94771.1 hypothetical protein BFJ63_vAg2642 [Fusarium oxysporum f. sp. narcissi]
MAEDLVVGIDVGVSGTGVAYRRKGHAEVNILEWGIDMKDPKTPTRVFYNVHDQPPKLVGWGTEVPDDSVEHLKLHEWFKVDLGEVDGDNGQVKSLYRDFLTSLYGELSTKRFTPASLGGKNFEEAEVLFLFSVPAIWDPAVVRDFTQLVCDSGFERVGLHSVRVTMTEPQAVAAYEICVPNLDYQLKDKRDLLVRDIEDVAWDLRNSNRFRICKHEFNPDKFRDLTFNISFKTSARDDLRDPPPPPSFVLAGESLGSLFDSQIDEINQHIRRFARAFGTDSETNSENHLDYIVLAGGLGSSRYVLGKIEEFIGKSQINFTAKTKVVMSAAPRLSVCMGLVYNAGRNPELFPRRFNRVSGGLVPDRVAVHEQTAYFSADLPSDKRIWELGILANFESDIERLTLEDNCRVHSVLKVKLSHIGEPEQTGTRDALSRLHLARKPKIQIKFDLRVEVGLATVEIQCSMMTNSV